MVHRLAEGDPARYAEAAAQMEVKYKRARERQAERLAHEKNVRRGKRRTGAAPQPEKGREPKGPPPRTRGTPYSSKGVPPRGEGARRDAGRGPSSGKGTGPAPGKRASPPGASRGAAGRGRTGPGAGPYAHSRPVKKGKGSFRKRES